MIADPGQYDIGAATARFGDLMKRVHDPAANEEFDALLSVPAAVATATGIINSWVLLVEIKR